MEDKTMTLVTYSPNRTNALAKRFFSDFWNESFLDHAYNYRPKVNLWQESDSYKIQFSTPGYSKESFQVYVEKDELVVKAQVEKTDEKEYTRKEFEAYSFEKKFKLPDDVDLNNIRSSYENGILEVVLPKDAGYTTKIRKEIQIN